MNKKFFILSSLTFISLLFLFCSSDSEEVNCSALCAKNKECEGDDEALCNKYCSSMNDKHYSQDSAVNAINECLSINTCSEYIKCRENVITKCTSVDISGVVNTICDKSLNQCVPGKYKTKEECAEDVSNDIKPAFECASKAYIEDMEKCIKTLSCEEFKAEISACQPKILEITSE